jgi:site-specific DNA-methyltransferase (cytosine-N4-specific)
MSPKRGRRSAIPVGTQFTPGLIDLRAFLGALAANSGNKAALLQAIWDPTVRLDGKSNPSRRTRSLPLEAAIQYQLLDKEYRVTELTTRLREMPTPQMYVEFAKHILLRLGGARVLQGIEELEHLGRTVSGDSLARHLTAQGFVVGEHNTQINSMRLWLANAGVFPSTGQLWKINGEVVDELIGLTSSQTAALVSLEPHQRAFVEAICVIGKRDTYVAADVRSLAAARNPHFQFDRGSLPNDILKPLADAGLITYQTRGTGGGKSSTFSLVPGFDAQVLEPFLTQTLAGLDPAVSAYFRRAPADIYADLSSSERTRKGRALEALAIRVMRLLGLRFLAWNTRAADTTGRAEVDAVCAGVLGAVPTRWQIQCKNTPGTATPLEDIAKEIGLIPITNATHLLFLTNGTFTAEARKYAVQIMKRSALSTFLLDRTDFAALVKDDTSLGRILRAKAEEIVRLLPGGTLFEWR